MLRQRRPLLAAVLVPLALVAIGGAAPPAIGSPPSGAPTSPGAAVPTSGDSAVLPAGKTYAVTLLTGDVVTVRGTGKACPQVSVVPAGPGRVVSRSCGPDGHVRVVPADAAGLIGKTLDPNLFDVTALIQQGYDDGHTSSLPVIVQQASGRSAAPLATSLGDRRSLPSIRATAGREPKKQQPSAAPNSARSGPTLSAELAGASHVWLDQRVRASDLTGAALPPSTQPSPAQQPSSAHSTGPTTSAKAVTPTKSAPKASGKADNSQPAVGADLTQIGAPQAWQAGYTGRGQTVAVLDTGIDTTHPDLVGKVVASHDFSGTGSVVDHFGHGTHVAATIAGTGAASGGVHRGVAPDAKLVIGKVLDDTGSGSDSSIIAGMQWAAPLASVVNMSLGGDYSDGTDPISQALDSLSVQYNTLFVVAAGNDGLEGEGTIQSPGAAAAALTVGAVDATDNLADFSSLGPEPGSEAAKPDITAPGVNTISARAAGTSTGNPVDAYYTADTGTSMATPHVAGAAAVLRQEHPGWSADQLKAGLMDTAAPVHGGDLYGHGAGRVDLTAATATPVVGGATAQLGTLSYPQAGTASDQVTWTNSGAQAATLALSLTVTDRQGNAAPAGAVTLSAASVSVPAGGHASATINADETALAARTGLYEGVLTARGGSTTVHTPVAFYVEPPSYDLTVTTTALPGTPDGALSSDAMITNLDQPTLFNEFDGTDAGAPMTVRVPAGDYSVIGDVWDTSTNSRDALAGTSEVHVTGPTTVVLDGAHARQVTATMAGLATQPQEVGIAAIQYARTGPGFWLEPGAWDADAARPSVYSTALSPVDVGTLHTYEVFGLRAPGTGPSPFLYDVARNLNGSIPADPSYVVSTAQRARMARIDLSVHQYDIPGGGTAHQRYLQSPDGALISQDETNPAPANRVDYVTPGWPTIDEAVLTGDSPASGLILAESGRVTYQPAAHTSIDLFSQPLHPDWYDNTDPQPTSECVSSAPSRTRGNIHVQLVPLSDSHDRFNCSASFWDVPASDAPALSLSRNGQQISSVAGFIGDFTVPTEVGNYSLTLDENASSLVPVSTHTTTTWTFRSTGPSGDGSVVLPLLSVNYGLPMDANDHPTGNQATFTVSQAHGVPVQDITGMKVWTSTDDGATWQASTVQRSAPKGGPVTFTATLPAAASGQAVSLRVSATGSAGSGIDQTIIRAYTAS